jgi:hypothetical protein
VLTAYQERLSEPVFADFLEHYRRELARRIDFAKPYFFTFKRILLWGLHEHP